MRYTYDVFDINERRIGTYTRLDRVEVNFEKGECVKIYDNLKNINYQNLSSKDELEEWYDKLARDEAWLPNQV
jgi:hypothetical protein